VTVGTVTTSYAVVPSCDFKIVPTAADQSTASMSHELIEAATDPQPNATEPGYVGFTATSFAFDYFQEFQSETGDACELFGGTLGDFLGALSAVARQGAAMISRTPSARRRIPLIGSPSRLLR